MLLRQAAGLETGSVGTSVPPLPYRRGGMVVSLWNNFVGMRAARARSILDGVLRGEQQTAAYYSACKCEVGRLDCRSPTPLRWIQF